MFKFHYDIELTEEGRPYIVPVGDTEKEMSMVEHKFMGLEMARTVVSSTIELHESDPITRPLPEEELERLKNLEFEITRLSNIYSITIKEQFELMAIADSLLNKDFDFTVLTEEERDNLKYNAIIRNDRMYVREEGLKVKIIRTGEIFELVGGIDNEHWTKK